MGGNWSGDARVMERPFDFGYAFVFLSVLAFVCITLVHADQEQANFNANQGEGFSPYGREPDPSSVASNDEASSGTRHITSVIVPARASLRSPYQAEQ